MVWVQVDPAEFFLGLALHSAWQAEAEVLVVRPVAPVLTVTEHMCRAREDITGVELVEVITLVGVPGEGLFALLHLVICICSLALMLVLKQDLQVLLHLKMPVHIHGLLLRVSHLFLLWQLVLAAMVVLEHSQAEVGVAVVDWAI